MKYLLIALCLSIPLVSSEAHLCEGKFVRTKIQELEKYEGTQEELEKFSMFCKKERYVVESTLQGLGNTFWSRDFSEENNPQDVQLYDLLPGSQSLGIDFNIIVKQKAFSEEYSGTTTSNSTSIQYVQKAFGLAQLASREAITTCSPEGLVVRVKQKQSDGYKSDLICTYKRI